MFINAIRNLWKDWTSPERLSEHEGKLLLVLTLIIGAVVGLTIVAFIVITENLAAYMYPAEGAGWRRVFIPVLGSLVAGFFLYHYFPGARGSGIPQTKMALFIHDGYIRFRTVIGKFCCSSISLASGIALGREGPSVQVGAGIASVLGQRLGLSASRIRALVPVGASAALSAAFNTPIAAVLFSLEEVLGDLHAPVLGSVVLSSATSWIVLHLLLGDEPLFHVPSYQLVHPLEFAIYAVLGIIGGLVSVSFVKLLLWLRVQFFRMPVYTKWFQPAAGGLLVGLMGWFVPEVLGIGYVHVGRALNGHMALGVMAMLVVLKVIATATCYSSGNAGGIFGPSLFIGAMMGGAVGSLAHLLLPEYTGSVGAYALVGMGTAFAGILRVPFTSVIMIFEITRDYSIIVPLMISNMISFFISQKLQKEPIYEALVHQEGMYLPRAARDRLAPLQVKDAMRPIDIVLPSDARVADLELVAADERHAWPVVHKGRLIGMLRASVLEEARKRGSTEDTLAVILGNDATAACSQSGRYTYVHVDHHLDMALRRMAETRMSVLPVVSRGDLKKLEGLISTHDVLGAYGLGKETGRAEAPPLKKPAAPTSVLPGVIAISASLLVVASLLIYGYHNERRDRARQEFEMGNELARQERIEEAVEHYRYALSISHTAEHRQALAMALVQAGRWKEAGVYLRELLKENAGSGPANLGMARVAAGEGKAQEAITYYHRAIYGSWPGKPGEGIVQVHFELVGFLAKIGAKTQAVTELLALRDRVPDDITVQKRIGRLLLTFDAAEESAAVFRDILRQDQRDGDAYAGLGEAEFARARYRLAREAFRGAVRWNPADGASMKRLATCNEIIALDPTLRGLTARERHLRSLILIEKALGVLTSCVQENPGAQVPDSVMGKIEQAHTLLSQRKRPSSYSDAAEANILLAGELWTACLELCKPSPSKDDPLFLVFSMLS
jgi:CIC family chloride channel protein